MKFHQMSQPRTRFVVFCEARSGSTLLRLSLHGEDDVICHGEVLSRAWVNGLVPEQDPSWIKSPRPLAQTALNLRSTLPAFFDRYIWNFDTQAVGFKIIFEDLFKSAQKNEILDTLDSYSDFRPALLYRKNHLASFVSRLRMAEHRITHQQEADKAATQTATVHVDRQAFLRYRDTQKGYIAQLQARYPAAPILTYETLAQDYSRFTQYLGLRGPRTLKEAIVKTGARDLRTMISNYDEVADLDLR